MSFHLRTIRQVATLICGNFPSEPPPVFIYRSSSKLTQFFENCETDHTHGGQTRDAWVAGVLSEILNEPQTNPPFPPDTFLRVIQELMDQSDAFNEESSRPKALEMLNAILKREGFEAYYAEDAKCYLRHVPSHAVSKGFENPHRPFSADELERREKLTQYLDKVSEDELITEVLLPLFRQLSFHRVTAAGHEDKALEYGKDVWMRYRLPTQHYLYFGLQAKIGKVDSAGKSEKGSANIAEILNQVTMMLGHEVFDPETNKRASAGSRVHCRRRYDHQGGSELARPALGQDQAQSGDLHGPRRHSESLRRIQHPAAERRSTASGRRGRLRRRHSVLATAP